MLSSPHLQMKQSTKNVDNGCDKTPSHLRFFLAFTTAHMKQSQKGKDTQERQ